VDRLYDGRRASPASDIMITHCPPTLLGMMTGIGGGIARDMLLAEIPTVLRADLYAVAALAGAAVVVIGHMLRLPSGVMMLTSAILCFGLRVMAIRRGCSFRSRARPSD
jgi:uncharacterized membrane protein YeiH